MFLPDSVLALHRAVLKRYGGGEGIRDAAMLDSALKRAFATFEDDELYVDVYAKAAAIFQSVIMNHPFVDGNKRMGFLLGTSFLLEHHVTLAASEDERFDFIMGIASGDLGYDNIVTWLRAHSVKAELTEV